jgi:glycosyltransferase involved in cell wall biosynthesis
MAIDDDTRGVNSTADAALASIALCTYNGARFLSQQLDSLIAQTWPNIEIVVVDDCSTDDTLAILDRYARLDPRIRVAINERNVGFARNFELALQLCQGVYVAPCDQDDIWLPDKISTLVAAIGSCSLAYCDSTLVNECGEPTGYRMSQIVPMLTTDDPAAFAFGNCVSGHAMLFRRDLLERALPAPQGFFYDWWIAAVAASVGGVVSCERSLVFYRQHGGNVTDARLAEMVEEAGIVAQRKERAGRNRPRGHKLRYLRETEQRLASLARLPGRHQSFIERLHRLWRAREQQWISPRLGYFMARHRDRLLAITTLPARKRKRFCRQFFWGVQLKRLTDQDAYAQG